MFLASAWVSGVQPGMSLADVATPVLCLEVGVLERNIAAMTDWCRQNGKSWRPHIKGHRCPQIVDRLRRAGWRGVTCATLREAEFAASLGVEEILIANQIALGKLPDAARIARLTNLILTFDHPDQVAAASEAAARAGVTFRAIVELDIGMGRAGVQPGPAAVELATSIDRAAHLELVGIMGYEGHLLDVPDQDRKKRAIQAALDLLGEARNELLRRGLRCDIVSAGGTGSCEYTATHPAVTELQAGGLVMMDAYYRNECRVERFDYALTVLTTVVSRPAPDRAIIDAGRKVHDISHRLPVFPHGPEGIRRMVLNAEHGILEVDGPARALRIGQRLTFVPGYSDFTTMLHRCFVAHRGQLVVGIWPIGPR